MSGIKFFNFAIPIDTYKKLKMLSNKTGVPISEMLRQGISLVLGNSKSGTVQNEKTT